MSTALAGLSQYADSDSDAETPYHGNTSKPLSSLSQSDDFGSSKVAPTSSDQSEAPTAPSHQRPKRKLPPLYANRLDHDADQASLESKAAIGSHSSKKVARGDWLCYCFIDIPLDRSLSSLIEESHAYLQSQLGATHSLLDLRRLHDPDLEAHDAETKEGDGHLHISLTRPFTVRSSERDEYIKIARAELQKLRADIGSFPFSFSRIAYLDNDDGSRHFMVLEVGSGREKFHQLSTALSNELRRAFRAKAYYEDARFHASTACLETADNVDQQAEAQPLVDSRFRQIVTDIEKKWGPQLRKQPPTWAVRVGIQVANRITYIDI